MIALWQAGFKETVAGCGTALTVEQLRLLSRYTKNVIACFDGDSAGRKASMRALEIFLAAGLLGRGIFIPSGFDPDTFIRERGPSAFAELADNAELLVDYFLSEQSSDARGSIDARARAAARVAEMLKLVEDPFQFDLLARKAADLLGIGEEVLREQARGRTSHGTRPRYQRDTGAAAPRTEAGQVGGAGAKAEIGLVAIALLHPELRTEIAESGASSNFEDLRLAGVLADLCKTDEDHAALEQWLSERLSDEQQGRLSGIAVDAMIETLEQARALIKDYATALGQRRHGREVETLRRSANDAATWDEAKEKSQDVVLLRRAQSKMSTVTK